MPELPEVETIRSQLFERIVGRKILNVHVRLPKVFTGDPKNIIGATIVAVERRAKIILIKLDNNSAIAVHLKMTGQLVFGETKESDNSHKSNHSDSSYSAQTVYFAQGIPFAGFELPGKTTHVVIDLSDGGKLFFNDNRQFGWMKIVDREQWAGISQKHGPEPFSDEFTGEYLEKICQKWNRAVKLLLMEQSKIAGIGNIYANEALWLAGIDPHKVARMLGGEEVRKLHKAILEVLEMGIKFQGSSAHMESYITALGEKGSMQEHFEVYSRSGKMCSRCGGEIKMTRIGGRGTFYCGGCQK